MKTSAVLAVLSPSDQARNNDRIQIPVADKGKDLCDEQRDQKADDKEAYQSFEKKQPRSLGGGDAVRKHVDHSGYVAAEAGGQKIVAEAGGETVPDQLRERNVFLSALEDNLPAPGRDDVGEKKNEERRDDKLGIGVFQISQHRLGIAHEVERGDEGGGNKEANYEKDFFHCFFRKGSSGSSKHLIR